MQPVTEIPSRLHTHSRTHSRKSNASRILAQAVAFILSETIRRLIS